MSKAKSERQVSNIIFREDLYPRFNPDPALIQAYAENIDKLPPIEIEEHDILIDGYHRLKAHETAGHKTIACTVTKVKSEAELQMLAVARNSKFGRQLSTDEKRHFAILWWQVHEDAAICNTLSITRHLFLEWTSEKRKQQQQEQKKQALAMWMACHTQQAIETATGMDRATLSVFVKKVRKDAPVDSNIFRNFTPEIYALWNFGKATSKVRHPGNIPPEVIDNLLYYFTQPFDVVFDPFAGGGSTIDKCEERMRRCYASDLTPIPARETEIREHDIADGLPDDLPVPDFIFLDPPYWQQAKHKYSKKPTDLANMSLTDFLAIIADIARRSKRKWSGKHKGKLAIIIGPWRDKGRHVDLPLLCYTAISKYLKLCQRVIVPYNTQIHGGAYVTDAKKNKAILYLTRDLMIFEP